jgi:hypothetical protein
MALPVEPSADSREERLVSVLSKARGRGGLQVTERWLFTVGAALATAGIMLVIVGWVGTSHTVLVAGQIPYVVSGGLLGLGLVFLGGFMYFGYWMALLVKESRERGMVHYDELVRASAGLQDVNRSLATIADLLASASAPDQAPSAPSRRRQPVNTAPLVGANPVITAVVDPAPLAGGHPPLRATVSLGAATLVATPSGTRAHLRECPLVAGRDDLRALAEHEGLRPCRVCLDSAGGLQESAASR